MILLAQQNLVFQAPREPAHFEESSILIGWLISVLILVVLAFVIWLIKRSKQVESTLAIVDKARDLHHWDAIISYWEEETEQPPYQLNLLIALLKQGAYLASHPDPTQDQLNIWLNLTPQELAQEFTKASNQQQIKPTLDIKSYLQKLNYLEHIRFNPQFTNLQQHQSLQSTLSDCLDLLKQAQVAHLALPEQHAN